MHRRAERKQKREPSLLDESSIVYDLRGVPVGVSITVKARTDDETPTSRHLARVTALRKTRELEGREWIGLGAF